MSFTVEKAFLMSCLRRAKPESETVSIIKYDCQPLLVKVGTTFTSDIFRVSVDYECDGKVLREFLVCKVPYLQQGYASMRDDGFYRQEALMYDTVLPKMMDILPLAVVPKHYLTGELDVLVLEDLTEQGYSMADHPWQLEPAARLLQEVAKFHAASVRLSQLEPAVMRGVSRVTFLKDEFVAKTANAVYPHLMAILKLEKVDARVLHNFVVYGREMRDGGIWRIANRAGNFAALIHSHLKAPNILLRSGATTSVKIIDYQTCVWNSPALELRYFFMMTVDHETFVNHHDDLVDGYLASLNASLRRAGCECSYTKEEYHADVQGSRSFQVFVLLLVALFDVRAALPEFSFGEDSTGVPDAAEVEKIRHSKKFRGRFLKWFRYFEKLGYFDRY